MKQHFFFILTFVFISVFLTMGRMGTEYNSFPLLGGDLGVYISMAVAQDEPGLFVNDPFLSNEKNINSYNMVFFPMIRGLKGVFGSYPAACLILLPLFILIHLVGFYLLGISIFKNSWAGFYVSLILSVPVNVYYDFWGVILDALPRFLYQGLIPYILALSIARGHDLKWWPVIMAGLGVLNYVHPVSTPVWTVAILMGLWVSADQVRVVKKIRAMMLAVFILVIILVPFLINYFSSTIADASPMVDYELTKTILDERFITMGSSGLIGVLLNFFSSHLNPVLDLIWYLMCALAAGGLIYGLSSRVPHGFRPYLRQITAWMTGVFLVGAVVPVVEQNLFARLRQIPPEFELLRTLRFLLPLMLLSAVFFLWLIKDRYTKFSPAFAFHTLATVLLMAWGARGWTTQVEFREAVDQNIKCWMESRLICPLPEKNIDLIGVLDSVRAVTPIGSRIFAEDENVAVRYYAYRPLMYTYKDGAPLAYTDRRQLLIWVDRNQAMAKLARIRKFPDRRTKYLDELVEMAISTKAEYLLLEESHNPGLYYPESLSLIYANNHYSLYEITR